MKKEKVKVALELLCEETTSLEKINKIAKLLKGKSAKTDEVLDKITIITEKIQKISGGEVISLSVEKLPEKSKKDKERKKLILLLLGYYKDLQGEVVRISGLSTAANATEGGVKTAKILATAKGPLGVITIAAAGIVAVAGVLNSQAVEIKIKNIGCRPIEPVTGRAIDLPGLKLPSKIINSGSEDSAKIPAIRLTVAMSPSQVSLKALGYEKSFSMSGEIKDIIYDGQSLLNKTTELKLGSSKNHELIVKCQ